MMGNNQCTCIVLDYCFPLGWCWCYCRHNVYSLSGVHCLANISYLLIVVLLSSLQCQLLFIHAESALHYLIQRLNSRTLDDRNIPIINYHNHFTQRTLVVCFWSLLYSISDDFLHLFMMAGS